MSFAVESSQAQISRVARCCSAQTAGTSFDESKTAATKRLATQCQAAMLTGYDVLFYCMCEVRCGMQADARGVKRACVAAVNVAAADINTACSRSIGTFPGSRHSGKIGAPHTRRDRKSIVQNRMRGHGEVSEQVDFGRVCLLPTSLSWSASNNEFTSDPCVC